jgi:hypothetical protein
VADGPLLTKYLQDIGLGSLTHWASDHIQRGSSEAEIELSLYRRPEFQARFPGIFHREKYGYPPISVAEYLSYENTVNQMARSYGVTLSKERVDALISLNVSANETEERLGLAAQAVFRSDPTTRERLSTLYGIGTGDLISYWLNPREELPKLQRRFVAADVAGAAIRAGFDQALTAGQAEFLVDRGMTGEAATESFGTLVQNEELFEAVDVTETDIDVDEQLRLITGDVDIAQQVERRGERRRAMFEGGGGFATGESGVAGLGTANR